MLDNFSGAHDDQNTLPSCSPQNPYSLTLRLSTLNQQLSLRSWVETRSLPALTHVLPPISTSRFCPSMSLASPRLRSLAPTLVAYVDHSHCPVLAPATLAALPSTRAIETRSLPTSLAATHRGFAFYVASPQSSIPSIATCSISAIPFLNSWFESLALTSHRLKPDRFSRFIRSLKGI